MCMRENSTRITKEDVAVFKLMRFEDGEITTYFRRYMQPQHTMEHRQTRRAFEDCRGFHCFARRCDAIRYLERVTCQGTINAPETAVVCRYKMPKGIKYRTGTIPDGFYGAGMKAIRAQNLSRHPYKRTGNHISYKGETFNEKLQLKEVM